MRHGPAALVPGNSFRPGRRRTGQVSGRRQPAAGLWIDVQLCHLCSDCCQISPSICVLWFNLCRESKSSACALLGPGYSIIYIYGTGIVLFCSVRTNSHLKLSQSQQQPWRSAADLQMQHPARHMHPHCLHPAGEPGHTPAALCPGPHPAWQAAHQAVSCRHEGTPMYQCTCDDLNLLQQGMCWGQSA